MNELTQNGTSTDFSQISESEIVPGDLLKIQQEQWITFCALGGLITSESDDPEEMVSIRQMTITEFSETTGVPRRTLYNWKKQIPNFTQRVRTRRGEVFSLSRETAAFNRLYMIGMGGKTQAAVDALKTCLGHFSKLELATQRHEVDAGQNLMELVNGARKKRIIDGDGS